MPLKEIYQETGYWYSLRNKEKWHSLYIYKLSLTNIPFISFRSSGLILLIKMWEHVGVLNWIFILVKIRTFPLKIMYVAIPWIAQLFVNMLKCESQGPSDGLWLPIVTVVVPVSPLFTCFLTKCTWFLMGNFLGK